jgi:hypothetical protein
MTTPTSFSVVERNHGHWDICAGKGRVFAIRGGPGSYFVRDEREATRNNRKAPQSYDFKTIGAATAWICDILMFELIIAKDQVPHEIEAWNIR